MKHKYIISMEADPRLTLTEVINEVVKRYNSREYKTSLVMGAKVIGDTTADYITIK